MISLTNRNEMELGHKNQRFNPLSRINKFLQEAGAASQNCFCAPFDPERVEWQKLIVLGKIFRRRCKPRNSPINPPMSCCCIRFYLQTHLFTLPRIGYPNIYNYRMILFKFYVTLLIQTIKGFHSLIAFYAMTSN